MKELFTICVLYTVYAVAILVWSTFRDDRCDSLPTMSQGSIEYVGISNRLLLEWVAQYPYFVVFDIHHDRRMGDREDGFASYWLPISTIELPNLLRWIPPASRVVFCCKNASELLDASTKTTLRQLGIGTVYFLSDSPVSQSRHRDLELRQAMPAEKLRKEKMREAGWRL